MKSICPYLCAAFLKDIIERKAVLRFPGCSSAGGGRAEIIPVEPDQGNACAGKVVIMYSSSFRGIPPHNFS
jgi:hypothetical protein